MVRQWVSGLHVRFWLARKVTTEGSGVTKERASGKVEVEKTGGLINAGSRPAISHSKHLALLINKSRPRCKICSEVLAC